MTGVKELREVYYEVIKEIPNKDWIHFARLGLQLEESDIDNITHDYHDNIKERNFQFCKKWEGIVGRQEAGTIRERMKEFLSGKPNNASSSTSVHQTKGTNDEKKYSRMAIVCHKDLTKHAMQTKSMLEKKGINLHLHSSDAPLDADSSFIIFIVSRRLNLEPYKALSFSDNAVILVRESQKNRIPLFMKRLPTIEITKRLFEAKDLTELIVKSVPLESIAKHGDQPEEIRSIQEVKETCLEQEEYLPESSDVQPDWLTDYSNEFSKLELLKDKSDKKHAYILVASSIRKQVPHLKSIVQFPWLRVYDFDPKSRVIGFLSWAESTLASHWEFKITDTLDKTEDIVDNVTNWVFLNGYCTSAETDFSPSKQLNPKAVVSQCDSLVRYCSGWKVPFIVVLWYPSNSNADSHLDKFISSLQTYLEGNLDIFKCVICVPTFPNKKTTLGQTLKRLDLNDAINVLPLEVFCAWMKMVNKKKSEVTTFRTLPKMSEKKAGDSNFNIKEKDFIWLTVCFDILTMDITPEKTDIDACGKKGEEFLKGGNLTWDVIASKRYVANRDILQDKTAFVIKQYIKTGKSGIIRIFHSPGGGGTTFAKSLLWKLKSDAPCLELKPMFFDIDEVKKRLRFIRHETHLPPVLLIDGNSAYDINTLLEYCRYERVVILHVQRVYISSSNIKMNKEAIMLPEKLSFIEAQSLTDILSVVKPANKDSLQKLTDEVEGGLKHVMFEYGLTAYDSEFHGIKRYVHGNLQIFPKTKLEDWHRVLSYLAFAYYFGHCGLPCKLFGELLNKTHDVVKMDDLPYSGQKFVYEDVNGIWRISYYIVAKEILEQVLVKRDLAKSSEIKKALSGEACRYLCELSIEFIAFIRKNLSSQYIPPHIKEILTAIFIRRNYKDSAENDEFGSKSWYSRLIDFAKSIADKEKIFLKLVESFPSNPEFHAHLGRFYGQIQKFDEAAKYFGEAIKVRNGEITGKTHGDAVLYRIHNMYGYCLNEKLKMEISRFKQTKRPCLIAQILNTAREAINHFNQSRNFYHTGLNASYIYLGEIKSTLLVAEFANEISNGNLQTLFGENNPASYKDLANFVLESFSQCDQLLAECMYHASPGEIPKHELNICVNKFNTFFGSTKTALQNWVGRDRTVNSKKCHLHILKMDARKQNRKFSIYDDSFDDQYIKKFIALYEGIFKQKEQENLEIRVSVQMIDWLQAIRHPNLKNDYCFTEVKSRVEDWCKNNERGSLSTYYMYVLASLLAINGLKGEVSNNFSNESKKHREKLSEDSKIPEYMMERSLEWLAACTSSQSFRNIIHWTRLGDWDGKFWKSSEKVNLLRVCKGTVEKCSIYRGYIVLDGGHKPPIEVFLNPQRYGFNKSEDKQKLRVEFYIGFNPKHGAEAYQVQKLEKHDCRSCGTPTEIPKLGKNDSFYKAPCIRCDKEVKVD